MKVYEIIKHDTYHHSNRIVVVSSKAKAVAALSALLEDNQKKFDAREKNGKKHFSEFWGNNMRDFLNTKHVLNLVYIPAPGLVWYTVEQIDVL